MYFNLVMLVSIGSIIIAFLFALEILKKDSGTQKMQEISNAIKEGANAFLKRQYTTIAILSITLAVIIFLIYALTGKISYGWHTSIAFILGALCSSISGFVGMYISVRSNVRVAASAEKSMNEAVVTALRGGAVSGILVVALSLLGVAGIFLLYGGTANPLEVPLLIVGFGFGASFVALFAQLGGGIYTKAADVGADLVGKVEAGIPEDDPRNPAVIADLVGDNVGDCAGRGADLFESTAAENIGAMILGIALYPIFGINGIIFPLVARAFGLIASIIGVMCVKVSENEDPMGGLNRGYLITTILAAAGFWLSTKLLLTQYHTFFFLAGLVGILTSFAFVSITQYYTEYRYRPVKDIARASETGPATNIITGFSVALECTGLPILVISVALLLAYYLGRATGLSEGGLYGTAVATMGMLSTCAYILAMDTFGPITDNAGGIVEMSGASQNIRKRTDRLDAIGNTTKALTKGYAVGSAALAAFLLFSAYLEDVHLTSVDLTKPVVFVGAMLGAVLVFIFSAFAIRAVGNAAYYIINNVRKQFKEKPEILENKEKPDYAQAVDICTRGALKEMILPGLTAVIVPLIIGLFLGPEAVGATLMVGTIAGIILALVLNNGGGAWDNAKKYIEAGAYGGKGSPAHKAAVVGDTVGDPFKDTAGPSLHVLVKLLSTLTLVFAPLFLILHSIK
ncbi:MAG TPA: sodium-translocating pyrophosphatase [bacterium]|nr:sodium-translocating pyrophosphatase [bacterium]